jgi:hypothetical protein
VDQPRGGVGVEDHHAHGGGRGDVAGIVHVEHRDRGQLGVAGVDEDHRRDRGHGVDEEVDADVEDRRQADRHRDPAEGAPAGLLERGGHRLELRVHLLERGDRGQVRDGVEVGDGRDHQDRHGGVEEVEGVGWVVEEDDVGQPQHHARHRHRQHGEQLQDAAAA